jgi:hypothetical protein
MKDPKEALLTLIADLTMSLAAPVVIGGKPNMEEEVDAWLEKSNLLNDIATALRDVGEDDLANFESIQELREKLVYHGVMTATGHPT